MNLVLRHSHRAPKGYSSPPLRSYSSCWFSYPGGFIFQKSIMCIIQVWWWWFVVLLLCVFFICLFVFPKQDPSLFKQNLSGVYQCVMERKVSLQAMGDRQTKTGQCRWQSWSLWCLNTCANRDLQLWIVYYTAAWKPAVISSFYIITYMTFSLRPLMTSNTVIHIISS